MKKPIFIIIFLLFVSNVNALYIYDFDSHKKIEDKREEAITEGIPFYVINNSEYLKLVKFIEQDQTGSREYIEGKFTCTDFALAMYENMTNYGLDAYLAIYRPKDLNSYGHVAVVCKIPSEEENNSNLNYYILVSPQGGGIIGTVLSWDHFNSKGSNFYNKEYTDGYLYITKYIIWSHPGRLNSINEDTILITRHELGKYENYRA
jgi:hypothetical protein